MLETINGCGTWYCGKKNVHAYEGVCRACGRYSTLTSYDTRLFVVVVFIPVIPLGRRHIVEQCALCTKHSVIPMSEWDDHQRRVAQAVVAYRKSPADVELAKEALRECAAVRHFQAFLDLAPHVEKSLPASADALCLLAGVHDLFGRVGDAERVLRLALADCIMRQGRPDEAAPYVQHIIDQRLADRAGLLFQLAQGYQLTGDHDRALEMFRDCEAVNPKLGDDLDFVRLRDESARRQGTHTAVKPADVVRKAKTAASFRRFAKLGPVAAAVLFAVYLLIAWSMGHQTYIVNGAGKAYTVEINGMQHRLQPRQAKTVSLRDGEVAVRIVDPEFSIPAETAVISTPLLSRPFAGRTLVINPDRAAILQQARIDYVRTGLTGTGDGGSESTFHAGQLLYTFGAIDFPFQTPPQSVKMDTNKSSVEKSVLNLLGGDEHMSEMFALAAMSRTLGEDVVAGIAKRRLLFEPEQSQYLNLVGTYSKGDELIAFLHPFCQRRPVMIQWHRAYQHAMEQAGREEQLEREYDALLAAEPGSADLQYLAGRASRSLDKELKLCRQAADAAAPCAYAVFSLASYHLSCGEFAEAARLAGRALQLLPGEQDVRWFCKDALLAGGEYDRLMEIAREDERQPLPASLVAYREEVYLHTLRGRRDEAKRVVSQLKDQLERTLGPKVSAQEVGRIEAEIEYCGGNPKPSAAFLANSEWVGDRIAAHVIAGDLAAAERELKETPAAFFWPVLIYISASSQGQKELADKHLKAAIEQLGKGDAEERAFAKALAGETPLPLPDLLRQRHAPKDKLLLLTALGLRTPAARDACFELARKLNYDRRFPHLILKSVHEARPR